MPWLHKTIFATGYYNSSVHKFKAESSIRLLHLLTGTCLLVIDRTFVFMVKKCIHGCSDSRSGILSSGFFYGVQRLIIPRLRNIVSRGESDGKGQNYFICIPESKCFFSSKKNNTKATLRNIISTVVFATTNFFFRSKNRKEGRTFFRFWSTNRSRAFWEFNSQRETSRETSCRQHHWPEFLRRILYSTFTEIRRKPSASIKSLSSFFSSQSYKPHYHSFYDYFIDLTLFLVLLLQ